MAGRSPLGEPLGKRSNFERRKNDAYDTPREAVKPLLPFLEPKTKFIEPCAGNGELIKHLEDAGHECVAAWDLHPRRAFIARRDATTGRTSRKICYITNPPWTREILHPIIANLSAQATTWLLFDADWFHTRQAWPLWRRCSMIVAVGRIKWIPGSKFTGKDNCCWYRFETADTGGPRMVGRF